MANAGQKVVSLHAHSVQPGQVVQGGRVAITTDMQAALSDAQEAAKLDSALPVSFVLNTTTRTSDMRDRLLDLAFGTARKGDAAAADIASALASAMDNRSKPCLLVA